MITTEQLKHFHLGTGEMKSILEPIIKENNPQFPKGSILIGDNIEYIAQNDGETIGEANFIAKCKIKSELENKYQSDIKIIKEYLSVWNRFGKRYLCSFEKIQQIIVKVIAREEITALEWKDILYIDDIANIAYKISPPRRGLGEEYSEQQKLCIFAGKLRCVAGNTMEDRYKKHLINDF